MNPLSQSDILSGTWKRIEEHYKARLESLRKQNDFELSEVETAKLRGRIAEVQALLALATPPAPVEDAPPVD